MAGSFPGVLAVVNRNGDRMVDGWLSLLFPSTCAWCGAPGSEACPPCQAGLPWNDPACPGCARPQVHGERCGSCAAKPPPFDAAWTAFRLEVPVQKGIHRLKYQGQLIEAARLGRLLAPRLPSRPDLILPVPLHRWRLARRGYNQAGELARQLGRLTGIPTDPRLARRIRPTPDQIGLTAVERRRNLRGAFHISSGLDGLHVALLDDVMTTGATLAELARACRAAGAARVEAWALARTA